MDNPLFLFSVPCHCFHNIILVPCSLQGIQICDIMSMVTGGFIYLFYLNKIGGGGGGGGRTHSFFQHGGHTMLSPVLNMLPVADIDICISCTICIYTNSYILITFGKDEAVVRNLHLP